LIYRVVFTASARADSIRQFRYLADRSADSAARWYTGLEKAIAKLSKMPERHAIAQDESEQLGVTLRQMLYGRRPGVFSDSIHHPRRYRHGAPHPPRCPRPNP
jgi:plasmid stabilization system protein ParE